MRAFVSYHRSLSKWLAYSIKEKLVSKGVDVFLDVKNINSGRFENVIHNEIADRDHFIVVLSPETLHKLAFEKDWVRREVALALELKKNVIPLLTEGASIAAIPANFPNREVFLKLSTLNVSFDFFDEAMDRLYSRYLANPTIQELDFDFAEQHFSKGLDAQKHGDWKTAEVEYEKAVGRVRLPQYLICLCVAKHKQGRDVEALKDIDAAIAINPFADEIMTAKFDLLQHAGRMQDAINLPNQWKRQAQNIAQEYAYRILAGLESGLGFAESAKRIPELTFIYADKPNDVMIEACVACLSEHISGKLQDDLMSAWRKWCLDEYEMTLKGKK